MIQEELDEQVWWGCFDGLLMMAGGVVDNVGKGGEMQQEADNADLKQGAQGRGGCFLVVLTLKGTCPAKGTVSLWQRRDKQRSLGSNKSLLLSLGAFTRIYHTHLHWRHLLFLPPLNPPVRRVYRPDWAFVPQKPLPLRPPLYVVLSSHSVSNSPPLFCWL